MKLEWVKDIPNYESYLNTEHQEIIQLIGIDNYLVLFENFGKTGIYFSRTNNNNQLIIEQLIGQDNCRRLYNSFCYKGIYFGGAINQLKKVWACRNKHVAYNDAARLLDVSIKSIYRWRAEREEHG